MTERHLVLLREALTSDSQAFSWRRPRSRTLLLAAALFALAAAAIATAATLGLFDRDVTRADLDARVTTITRTTEECRAAGDCGPPRTETVRVGEIRPSDGIALVDPEGMLISITPAAGTIQFPSASSYGSELAGQRHEANGTDQAKVELPGGGTRVFTWRTGEGHLTVTDVHPDGASSSIILRSGDVVPLLPGSLAEQPLTPDKAITFDLSRGGYPFGGYPLRIYPQRNEAYVGVAPWRASDGSTTLLPAAVARRYGLSERDGQYVLPVSPSGGSWSYTVDHGRIRTVTWKAGETTVTVTDRDGTGKVLGTESLSVGREVYAG